jgi:uncharacterized glyoxalase superfamily protein PhnB
MSEPAASVGGCIECGFVYDLDRAGDAGAAIIATTATISAIVQASDAIIRRRPESGTWSILEYGCHVRDVLLVQRERVLLALRVDEPEVVPMGRDERVDADGYREQDPVAVARQIRDAALLFSGVLARLDEASWRRTLIYNYPQPTVRAIAWVAVHTLHEVVHHLGDIRRQIGDSTVVVSGAGARDGYHSVTPRIVVSDVAAQVDFLRDAFGSTGEVVGGRPAEIRIGDSLVMVSSADERDLFPAFLYVYVDDADACYERSVAAGATTIEAPLDTPYGDRRAMVRDPFGNIFQIAQSNDSANRLS